MAITLALSILVPLFTQIANNKFQIKMQREKIMEEQNAEKRKVFQKFLLDCGACISCADAKGVQAAGASLYNVYLFSPKDWWGDLDNLSKLILKREWENAGIILQKLSRLISEELNK